MAWAGRWTFGDFYLDVFRLLSEHVNISGHCCQTRVMHDDYTPYLYAFWESLSKDEIATIRSLLVNPAEPLPAKLEHRLGKTLGCDPGEIPPKASRAWLLEFAAALPETCAITVGPPIETSSARAQREAMGVFGHRNFHWTQGGSAGRNHTAIYVEGPVS